MTGFDSLGDGVALAREGKTAVLFVIQISQFPKLLHLGEAAYKIANVEVDE